MTVSAKAAEDILCVEGECLSADAVDGLCAPRRPVRLVDCDLDGLDLSRRDLTGWTFERCSMRNGRFDGAMLERTVWKSCRAPIASFVGVDLSDAQFLSSDFNNSIFRRAKLTSLTVLSCKLTGADLYRVRQGVYRIVYSIHDRTMVIHVVKVGHRKEVYR